MHPLLHFLSGGFLAGKRTYLLVALAVLSEGIHWAVGDQSLQDLFNHLPHLLGELSIATLRAGLAATAPGPVTAELAAREPLQQAALYVPLDGDIPDAVRDWILGQQRRG